MSAISAAFARLRRLRALPLARALSFAVPLAVAAVGMPGGA